MTIKGKIKQILPVESGTSKSGKEWKKQSFVIDTGDQYNPDVCFSCFGDEKIGMLSSVKQGEQVEVSFNISSREFKGKWYHNIDAWRVQKLSESTPEKPEHISDLPEGNDDLPF